MTLNKDQSPLTATTAFIHLDALLDNITLIKKIAPESKLLAIIKANAYGHGALKVAQAIEHLDDGHSVSGFGVARLEEAIALRESGVELPIVLLEGFYAPQDLELLVKYNLETVVHCPMQLEALESANLKQSLKVWLKLDTGMHRLGVSVEDFADFKQRLNDSDNVSSPIHYISHFACADDKASPLTQQQLDCLASVTDPSECRSIAASAGILAWPESHLDWVRPGIIMYGISPFDDKTGTDLGFKPVMTLNSHLISVKKVKAGESVGYGATWAPKQDTYVGVVAIGYADGYPRSAPNGTPVWINGRNAKISGRVSMDMLCIDLGPESQDQVGDLVELWGHNLPVETVAAHVGTIAYELVTQLTSRVVICYQSS